MPSPVYCLAVYSPFCFSLLRIVLHQVSLHPVFLRFGLFVYVLHPPNYCYLKLVSMRLEKESCSMSVRMMLGLLSANQRVSRQLGLKVGMK